MGGAIGVCLTGTGWALSSGKTTFLPGSAPRPSFASELPAGPRSSLPCWSSPVSGSGAGRSLETASVFDLVTGPERCPHSGAARGVVFT